MSKQMVVMVSSAWVEKQLKDVEASALDRYLNHGNIIPSDVTSALDKVRDEMADLISKSQKQQS